MDIFTWSVPFVSEKITEMFYHILKPNDQGQDELSDEDEILNKDELDKISKLSE